MRSRELLGCIAHVFVLSSLVFAQPLFDLLSRHAAFLAAHKAGPLDLLGLVSILCVLIPAVLVCLELVACVFGPRMQRSTHLVLVATLSAVLSLSVIKPLEEVDGILLVVAAIGLGIGSVTCYVRFAPVRMFWTVLTPVVFLFPCLFLFQAPISQFVFSTTEKQGAPTVIRNPAPVILVVFDELPLVSILDENYHIDAGRYPNFSALAGDATWFRNASTVSPSTAHSVPAILSGVYPNNEWLPTTIDYPNTLFTLLKGTYQMRAFESSTALCPETVCPDDGQRRTAFQRFSSLLRDVAIVYLHIILPEDLTNSLPVVTQTWKNFGAEGTRQAQTWEEWRNRGERFAEAVGLFSQMDPPFFFFSHPLLPHVPWEYFPTGRRYLSSGMSVPGLDIKKEVWGDNEELVLQGYRRHLLQVGFIDTLLGNLLGQLRTLELYDQSLIVVTADHGASFWTNTPRRSADPYPGDVMRVPLFIKAPYQRSGQKSDRAARTIDVLPTIADILGIDIPWPVDGRSLNSSLVICSDGTVIPVVPETLIGYVDHVARLEGQTTIFGWAADITHSEAVKRLLIFADGKLIHAGLPNTERPDVGQVYEAVGIQPAGFHYTFPTSELTSADEDLRVFAISYQNVASELRYFRDSLGIWQQKPPHSLPTFDTVEHFKQSCSQSRLNGFPHTTFLARTRGLAGDGTGAFPEKENRPAFDTSLLPLRDSLERKLSFFGSGKGNMLLPSRPYKNLIGRSAPQISAGEKNTLQVALDYDPSAFDIRPDSRFVPAHIMGEVVGDVAATAALNLAVAINGTIQGVMPCYRHEGEMRFSIFIPEVAFQAGPNELTFFLVSGEETAPQFSRVNLIWRPTG